MSKPILSLSQDAAVRAGKATREESLSLAEALPVLSQFKKFSKTWAAIGSGIKDLGAVSDAGDARYLGEMVLKACDDMKSEMQKLLVQLSKEARGKA